MQERWDLLGAYPAQLRSYVQVFTTYTDAAFPSDLPSDYGLRVALRYEVGRFFASVERLKRAIAKQALEEAYTGKAFMPHLPLRPKPTFARHFLILQFLKRIILCDNQTTIHYTQHTLT